MTVPPGSLTESTLQELAAAEKVNTSGGRAALILAQRLDLQTADSGSSIAALVREHRATLTAATRDAKSGDDVDELKERREQRAARAR